MCGRTAFLRTLGYPVDLLYDLMEGGYTWREALKVYLGLEGVALRDDEARTNIAPTESIPTIMRTDAGLELIDTRWGVDLDVEGRSRLVFNATRERLHQSPVWRNALAHRGVHVLTGYYEWRNKQRIDPVFIHAVDAPLYLPCLVFGNTHADRRTHATVTITKEPTPEMAKLHDRMPVVLVDRREVDWWMDPELDTAEATRALAVDRTTGHLAFHPVSTRVNDANNKDKDLTVPRRTLDSFGA